MGTRSGNLHYWTVSYHASIRILCFHDGLTTTGVFADTVQNKRDGLKLQRSEEPHQVVGSEQKLKPIAVISETMGTVAVTEYSGMSTDDRASGESTGSLKQLRQSVFTGKDYKLKLSVKEDSRNHLAQKLKRCLRKVIECH